jgi:hypothetical protein
MLSVDDHAFFQPVKDDFRVSGVKEKFELENVVSRLNGFKGDLPTQL